MTEQQGRPPTEEELRAAYEAELQRIRVDEIVVQTIVSLLNIGGRRAGLAAGTDGERDLEQVHMAIEACRALLPLVEGALGPDAATLREALSQLQLAYAKLSGAGTAPAGAGAQQQPPQAEPAAEPGPGPAQRSGRLWVPGQ